MRLIDKAPEDIKRFNTWAKDKKLRHWEEDFSKPQSPNHESYIKVRGHILDVEQNGLSAYTEKPLSENLHIDHFRKKGMFPSLTFEYANFLVDERNDNYGACFKDNRADVSETTYDVIFDPVKEDLSKYTEYNFAGEMIPRFELDEKMRFRVKETIRVFNLNHKRLTSTRSKIIIDIRSYKGQLSDDDIRTILSPIGFTSLIDWVLSLPEGSVN